MAFPFAAVLSAAAPIIGGLFGKKEEKTTSTIDYVAMRKAAEKAGFNPLTALRAGGGAGFTTTHHPALASGQFIADAIGGLGNAIAQIDPMRDETAKLEFQLKQATLANIQADTAARQRASLGGVPVSTGARTVVSGSPLAANAGKSRTPTVETPTVTNPYPTSSGVTVDPNMPDAQAAEDRYGDILSNVFGVATLYQDAYGNFKRWMDDYRKQPAKPAVVLPALRRNASSWFQ